MGFLLIVDQAGKVLYRTTRQEDAERFAKRMALQGRLVFLMEPRVTYFPRRHG